MMATWVEERPTARTLTHFNFSSDWEAKPTTEQALMNWIA